MIISPLPGDFFTDVICIIYMFTVSQFHPEDYGDDPVIYMYCYDTGKVRLHRRGRYFRLDNWYSSFDDVLPVIDAIINSGKYFSYNSADGDITLYEYRNLLIRLQEEAEEAAAKHKVPR